MSYQDQRPSLGNQYSGLGKLGKKVFGAPRCDETLAKIYKTGYDCESWLEVTDQSPEAQAENARLNQEWMDIDMDDVIAVNKYNRKIWAKELEQAKLSFQDFGRSDLSGAGIGGKSRDSGMGPRAAFRGSVSAHFLRSE